MNAAASDPTPHEPPDGVTPGELLRRERERRSMSLQQAAEHLHLDAWTVEALEQNRFSALGAPVYAKGYLRKYAALLDLSPDVVIARYDALTDRPAAPTPIPATVSAPIVTRRISLKTPLLIAAAVIAAILVWRLVAFLTESPPSSPTTVAPPAVESTQRADVREQAPTTQSAAPVAVEATVETQPPPASRAAEITAPPAAAAPTSEAPTSGPQVTLRLEFSDTSWTEVYDATDRRLMFDLGSPGRVRTLTGVAPLRVTVGAASAVTAYVNGEPIVIPRREGRDASKFVVDASGAVRPGSR